MNTPKLAIFDMDGLIFDSERLFMGFLQKAAADLGYEITPEILDAAPAAAIVRRLSGFDASALHVYKSGGKDRPVWQFAWYAASDEGGRMYRGKVISDGAYCYALTVSVPEGAGTAYDSMLTEVFSSMELQPV